MGRVLVSFHAETTSAYMSIRNKTLIGAGTLSYKAEEKISINTSNIEYATAVILNTKDLYCVNSTITSADIYVPAIEHVELDNCIFTGTTHYDEF